MLNRFISINRLIQPKRLYIPAITIVALSLTLIFVVAISLYRNIHRERLHIRELLESESLAIIKIFSALICSRTISPVHEVTQQQTPLDYQLSEQDSYKEKFQQLAQAGANNPEIAYIAFLNSQGEVIAHSGLNENGFLFEADMLPKTGETLTNLKEAEHIFELTTEFQMSASDSLQTPKSFILLGLKTAEIEQAHLGDLKHTILMAVMLLLIGSASLYFIVVVQNYYLVDRTLGQMKTYIHHVVSSIPNGLISLDKSGYIITSNRAAEEMLLLSSSFIKGQHFSNIFKTNTKEIASVLESGEIIIEREIRYTQPVGEVIPLSLNATQLLDDSGEALGAVILLRDLREVKELQARAQRAEHLASIGRLASVVAHEIRNPLSSIRGFTQYFAAQFRDGTDEQNYAKVMMNEIDRLNRVIEELLDYSHPLALQRRETSIETILNHTIQLLQSDADRQGIRMVRQFSANMPSILVDSERITQALLNLCLNAIAAMDSGGTLTLATQRRHDDDKVVIIISDTGGGIAEEDLPQVFDPFFTTKSSGTGLGLAVVRKIIDYHEGSISIKSQLGQGTTVTIGLPIQNPSAKDAK